MPCPGPFHFSHSVDYIYEFGPLPNPDVGPSIFVCDVEHTSFHFGLCGRKFVRKTCSERNIDCRIRLTISASRADSPSARHIIHMHSEITT